MSSTSPSIPGAAHFMISTHPRETARLIANYVIALNLLCKREAMPFHDRSQRFSTGCNLQQVEPSVYRVVRLIMSETDLQKKLHELQAREPIFHRRQFGTSQADLEQMIDDNFWEIGASGKIYSRDFVISNLLERYKRPESHDWPCHGFSICQLTGTLYMINYILDEPERSTRRTTLWRKSGDQWKIVFHQGTVIV